MPPRALVVASIWYLSLFLSLSLSLSFSKNDVQGWDRWGYSWSSSVLLCSQTCLQNPPEIDVPVWFSSDLYKVHRWLSSDHSPSQKWVRLQTWSCWAEIALDKLAFAAHSPWFAMILWLIVMCWRCVRILLSTFMDFYGSIPTADTFSCKHSATFNWPFDRWRKSEAAKV